MTLIDLGPIPAEPLGLDAIKAWCRIERDDEDALLAGLARAARETVEADTRLVLVRRSFRLAIDPVPRDGWIAIERHPLVEVTRLTAFDAAGTPRLFGTGDYVVERAVGTEAVRVAPAVRAAAANGLEIDFLAGFAADAVPEVLRLAMKRIVAAAFEARGWVAPDTQPALVPEAARALIAPFRRRRLA